MIVICVTGTPGTGKTTLAKEICLSHGFHYLDVHQLIISRNLSTKYDRTLQTCMVDVKKVVGVLKKEIVELRKLKQYAGIVIDSHLSHYLSKKEVDLCIVTTCSLSTLKQRLKKRRYSVQKIKDNLEAETFDTCLVEAQEQDHIITIIETG